MGCFHYFSALKNGAGLWDNFEHFNFSVFFQIKRMTKITLRNTKKK